MRGASETAQGAFSALGIDIGTRMAKIIGLSQSADHIEIQAAINFDLPPGLVSGGIVADPKSLGRLMAKHLAAHEIRRQGAVFSIPSNLAVLRWLNLPDLPPDELRSAARFKVKRHLPFPVDDAYVEATPPATFEGEELGASLVIVVPKDVVASRAEALVHAGLTPIRAELEAQAILRVIERRLNNMSVLWRDASLTIIDVGGSNTHMYVVQNQRLQFIRGVKFGANLFVNAVSEALEIPLDEAETLLSLQKTSLDSEGGLTVEYREETVRVNLSEPLEKLTREFLRLLRYFRSLHPERSFAGILDHMVVCGGLVGLEGFCPYLEKCLGLRVERARPIAGVIAKFSGESFQSISNRQEALAVVMGLALSGLSQQMKKEGKNHAGRQFSWARAA